MTLRGRLLALTLSMIAIVALTLSALNVNILGQMSLDIANRSSEFAGQQVKSEIRRRLAQVPAAPSLEATKRLWQDEVALDLDLAAMLEETMAQSRSIVEINVAGEAGLIVASSNPRQIGNQIAAKRELRAL